MHRSVGQKEAPIGTPIRDLPDFLATRWKAQLDQIADALGRALQLNPGRTKDLLSGTWLGHPLHPLLTDATVGAWGCSIALDAIRGERGEPASRTLVGLGLLAAVPTVASGWADWSDTSGQERRVGLVHALGNGLAAAMLGISWLARRSGSHRAGAGLALVGGAVATATAYIGGHLVYGRGLGVDRTAFDPMIPKRWTEAIALLPAGKPVVAEVRGVSILLVRRDDVVHAMNDVCTHRGGPLNEGDLDGETVTCPWHGSCFRLEDGSIVRGPATAPQPSYLGRINGSKIEVRRAS